MPPAVKALCLAALAVLCLAAPHARAAAGADPRGPPLALEADRLTYRQDANIVEAAGGVDVRYAGYHLTADAMTYDRAAGRITATGDVVLTTPTGDVHRAQAFTLSGDMRDGTATALTSLLADDSHFRAARGERQGAQGDVRTTMEDAAYTPCPIACADGRPKTPDWEIEADKVVHDEAAQTITYRNARFRFFGVPLLYTPYFAHPDGSVEQKSGWLPPRFGYASDLGYAAAAHYYWAIAPDQDATVGVRAMTREKPLALAQWRKAWDAAAVTLDGSLTRGERNDFAPSGKDEWRGHLFADGLWDVDERWRTGFQARLVTDDRFLRRYELEDRAEDEDVLTSQVYAERLTQRNYAAVRALGFRDLRVTTQDVDQPHVLPEGEMRLVGAPGDVPIAGIGGRWGLDASALSLYRDGDGQDVQRASATATWVGREIAGFGLVTDWRASLRQDAYHVVDAGNVPGDPTAQPREDFTRGRFFPQAHVQAAYPLARPLPRGAQALLTPVAALTLGADLDQEGTPIPNEDSQDVQVDAANLFAPNRFPGLDRIEDGSRATYGLRGGVDYASGARVMGFIGQSYRFDAGDNPFPEGSGLASQASDVVAQVALRAPEGASPLPGAWDVDYRTQLGSGTLHSRRHEVDIANTWGPVTAGGRYLFAKGLEGTNVTDTREQVEGRAAWRVTARWALSARALYDLGADEGLREADFGVLRAGDCTTWGLRVERRLTDQEAGENGTAVMLRLGLKNLGDFEGGG